MTGLVILIFGGLGAIGWWRLLKGKETARATAAAACREHGLVLMDDTVMLEAVQLRKRDPVRAWGLRYRFDFAQHGVLHHGGVILLAPGQRPTVLIDNGDSRLIEEY